MLFRSAACPLVVLLFFIPGWSQDLFHTTAYYDVFMHSLGGAMLTITFAGILWHVWLKKRSMSLLRSRAVLIGCLVVASIAWEIFEVMFNLTPNWTISIADTISDMLYALAGAVIALCFIRLPGRPD